VRSALSFRASAATFRRRTILGLLFHSANHQGANGKRVS
jgi:hypothetical protein